jgi:small subunit ribosomal protein S20
VHPGRDALTTAFAVIEPPPWVGSTVVEGGDRTIGAAPPATTLRRPEDPLVDSPARMANIKSQIKRNKQNEVRRERNKGVKSALRTSTKKVYAAVAEGDAEAATAQQRETARALDKAAAKGVLHKKTAARKKSRLAHQVNATAAS